MSIKVALEKSRIMKSEERRRQDSLKLEGGRRAEEEKKDRSELFGKQRASIVSIVKAGVKGVDNFLNVEAASTTRGDTNVTEGTMDALNETKQRLGERGEKLSHLSDKTEELANASANFAKLAKELNEKQRNSWF